MKFLYEEVPLSEGLSQTLSKNENVEGLGIVCNYPNLRKN